MDKDRLGDAIRDAIDAITPLSTDQSNAMQLAMRGLAEQVILEIETYFAGGGGGTSNHTALSNLPWASSGHTGTASRVAGFSGAGAAAYYIIGTDLQAYSATLAAVVAGTYTGSSGITTLGTIATGVWNGTAIGDSYISSAATWNAKASTGYVDAAEAAAEAYADSLVVGLVPDSRTINGHALSGDVTVTKGDVGLGSVENTALSTWAGSAAMTTLGTIGTGVWQGTAITDTYIASAATWNAKEPAIAAGTAGQYWRGDKTWQTLDKSAVGLGSVENTALSTWAGSANVTTLGTIATGVWSGTAIVVGKLGGGVASAGKYLDGGGSWAALDKTAVGLGNVENVAASATYVPLTRTVNGNALSANVTITPTQIDVGLGSLVGVDTAADLMAYTTGANAWASTGLSAYIRTLLDDANEATARTTLGLAAGGAGDIWVEKAGDTMTGPLLFVAGTATAATWSKMQSGTVLAAPEAGALEFDGAAFYNTPNTTSGRGQDVTEHIFRLVANGGAIGPTIADFFGANSSIALPASSMWELEAVLYYLKTTAGTVIYTITNSAANYTNIAAEYTQTAVGGIGANAAKTGAGIVTTTTAAAALPATALLTTAVNHCAVIRATIEMNAAGNIRIRCTESAGTITPLRGSFYKIRRIPGNVGTFAA